MVLLKQCICCIIVVLFLPLSQSNAEQLPYYYGVEVGSSKYAAAGGGDPTIAIYFGQYLNEKILVEAGYASLGEAGDPSASVDVSLLYGGGILNLPISIETHPHLSFFLTAGLSSWYYKANSGTDSDIDIYYGLGGLYALDDTLSLRASIKRYVLNPAIAGLTFDEEIIVMSFGAQYRP